MTTNIVEGHPPMVDKREKRTTQLLGTESMVEVLAAGAAVVIAILGLASELPNMMVGVATILVGAAVLFQGAAIATRYQKLIRDGVEGRGLVEMLDFGGGVTTAESLAGIASIVLGILALLAPIPTTFCAVAVIVLGGAELFGSAATSRLHTMAVERHLDSDSSKDLSREMVHLSGSGQALIGLAAVILGILVLVGTASLPVVLVALLVIGCGVLLNGSSVAANFLGTLGRPSHR